MDIWIPVKNMADFFRSPLPMVDALETQQLKVPGFKASKDLFPGLTIIHSTFFPGPASCPWNECIVLAKARTNGQISIVQHLL